ncbi:glycerate kinase [Rhodococcoides fascians]|uniref:glycerate kinase n=1 Tax=Rhodococcoides fascians TaxID=1828 RepID=UPI0009B8E4BF|nr:glycerate kinase [Rhodococcus fascians]
MSSGNAQRVLIAPDSFKGSMSAASVADSIATGWLSVRPHDLAETMPQADGGEGTVDAVAARYPDAVLHHVPGVTGPDGRPILGQWLMLPSRTAVIELAQTSGLPLMHALDPGGASTRGLGEVMAAALDGGATRMLIGLGGSASTDGGAGMLQALGARLTDNSGADVGPGGIALADVASVDTSHLRKLPAGGVDVLTDTTAPLLGPTGAAAVFGPQKGASRQQITQLDRALAHFASFLSRLDPAVPGSGAAGGTGFGLLAWGAKLSPGADAIADLTGLSERIPAANVVVTGEGRYDATSNTGKLVGSVLSRCALHGVRSVVVAGQLAASPPDIAVSLADTAGSVEAAMAAPRQWLEAAGAVAAMRFSESLGNGDSLTCDPDHGKKALTDFSAAARSASDRTIDERSGTP